jgi:hypothetical protein
MDRRVAIDLARVEAAKLWAGTVTIHPDARTGPHHHGPLESVLSWCAAGRGCGGASTWSSWPRPIPATSSTCPQQEINAPGRRRTTPASLRKDGWAAGRFRVRNALPDHVPVPRGELVEHPVHGVARRVCWQYLSFCLLVQPLLSTIVITIGKIEVFERPSDLRIDTCGIELNVANRRNVYHWEQIEKAAVRRVRSRFVRGIRVYPLSGRHPPKRTASLSFPKLEKMTDQVFLAPIQDFKATPIEIETALARFAGSRWNTPERLGEVIQNDTIDR